ncbi:hypothetical protein BDF19DRAFT_431757 [Syncephalis fuscata]|nr:hypothetical protein BDF19DRAFT_431757 [Syncephalis fuscata]
MYSTIHSNIPSFLQLLAFTCICTLLCLCYYTQRFILDDGEFPGIIMPLFAEYQCILFYSHIVILLNTNAV